LNILRRIAIVYLALFSINVIAENGLVHIKSENNFKATTEKLNEILLAKGMTLFSRVKHSESGKKVGVELKPMELFIFGNPKIGSKIMKCSPSVAIDLPQKILVWENELKEVWLSYNQPAYLKERHKIEKCDKILQKVSKALNKITQKATKSLEN